MDPSPIRSSTLKLFVANCRSAIEYEMALIGAAFTFLVTIGFTETSSSSNDLWRSTGGGLRFNEAEVSNSFVFVVEEVWVDFISAETTPYIIT